MAFQGPVRPGTDVETFRETGLTQGRSTLDFETPGATTGMTEESVRRSSRSGSSGSRASQDFARAQAQAQAAADAQARAKAQAEADAQAKAKILAEAEQREITRRETQRRGEEELRKIQQRIVNLKRKGVEPRITESIDVRTKEKLRIVEYRGRGSSKVKTIENIKTGKVRYEESGTGKAGGSQRIIRSLELQLPKKEKSILKSDRQIVKVKEPIRTGEVQIAERKSILNYPSSFIEKITGRTPRELFRFIIGAKEKDKTKPITFGEAIVETTTLPGKALLQIVPAIGGKVVSERFPEEGFVVREEIGPIEYFEPQFGTITVDEPTGVKRVKVEKQVFTSRIFEREKVRQGVTAGLSLGTLITAPTLLFAPGFVTGGTRKALDTDLEPIERIGGAVEAATGVGIITFKTTQYLRGGKVITRTPVRPPEKPTATVITKPVKVGEEVKQFVDIRITGEVSPPMRIIESTRGSRLFDKTIGRIVQVGEKTKRPFMQLSKESTIPARTFITEVRGISGRPLYSQTSVSGQKFVTIKKISGSSKKITLDEFKALPKTEKVLLKTRAERIAGRPVSLKNVPKIISKEAEIVSSTSEAITLGRITPTGKDTFVFKPAKLGRRTTKQIGISDKRLIESLDEFDFSKSTSLTRDVTKPFSRSKIRELESYIFRLKEKPVGDSIKALTPANIKKTPYPITSQEQVESVISKIELPRIETPKLSKVILESPSFETPVVTKSLPSIYSGKGIYERTEIVSSQLSLDKRALNFGVTGDFKTEDKTFQETSIGLDIKIKDLTKIDSKGRGEFRIKEDSRISLKSRQSQDSQIKSKTKQDTKQETRQETKQDTIQESIVETITIQTPRPPRPPTTNIPGIKIPILPSRSSSLPKRLLSKIQSSEFEAFAIFGGKGISIGKAKTQKGAEKLLIKKLRKTLSASGFIETKGKKIKSSKLKSFGGGEFRKSKSDPFSIVEKKEKRLRKSTTGKAIQYFRKGKKSKGVF